MPFTVVQQDSALQPSDVLMILLAAGPAILVASEISSHIPSPQFVVVGRTFSATQTSPDGLPALNAIVRPSGFIRSWKICMLGKSTLLGCSPFTGTSQSSDVSSRDRTASTCWESPDHANEPKPKCSGFVMVSSSRAGPPAAGTSMSELVPDACWCK